MNYRHAYHAGNFADLVKHAVLLSLLDHFTTQAKALQVIDTHAGAGAYDLTGEAALKSGESRAGIGRLMVDAHAPGAFDSLKSVVAAMNHSPTVQFYPGSPILICGALRSIDRYLACELRADDHASLNEALEPYDFARSVHGDGYTAAARAMDDRFQALVLIDPPFEAADDYLRIAQTVRAVLDRQPMAAIAVWVPLKDLETFDALLRRLEADRVEDMLIAEARLRPLLDPLKMNGCAMLMINAPLGLDGIVTEIVQFVAATLGHGGGSGKVWRTIA